MGGGHWRPSRTEGARNMNDAENRIQESLVERCAIVTARPLEVTHSIIVQSSSLLNCSLTSGAASGSREGATAVPAEYCAVTRQATAGITASRLRVSVSAQNTTCQRISENRRFLWRTNRC